MVGSNGMTGARKRWLSLAAAVAFAVLGTGAVLAAPSSAATTPSPPEGYDWPNNVEICHATSSEKNPYVAESPAIDSSGAKGPLKGGHALHDDDIIPEFWYGDHADPSYYPGKNMDTGASIYANHCNETRAAVAGVEVTQAGCDDGDATPAEVDPVESDGVSYTMDPATPNAGDHVTVTATAADGFAFARDEQPDGWVVSDDAKTATYEVDLDEAPDCETSTPPAEPQPGIELVKDAIVADSHGTTYNEVGDVVDYTFTITNTGDVTLSNVGIDEGAFTGSGKVSDVDCGETTELEPGDSIECTATYTITQADLDHGSVENTATAHGTPQGDDSPITSDPDDATVTAASGPDLSIVKTVNTDTFDAGDHVTFTYVVTNDGNQTVYGVKIGEPGYADDADETNNDVESLLAPLNDPNFALNHFTGDDFYFTGTGELGDRVAQDAAKAAALAPGDSVTFTAPYTTTAADARAGHITNTAYAFGTLTAPVQVTTFSGRGRGFMPAVVGEDGYIASDLSDAALASVAGQVDEEPPVETRTVEAPAPTVLPVVTSSTAEPASPAAGSTGPLAATGTRFDVGGSVGLAIGGLVAGFALLMLGNQARDRYRRTH